MSRGRSAYTRISGTDTLTDWQRIRRYAVPERMIAECTAAREKRDWHLVCDAGDVDVLFDTAALAAYGASDAARIEDMLTGFAPDLVRWHLPRALGGYTTLATDIDYLLSGDGPVESATVVLVLRSPISVTGSQRLALDVARAGDLDESTVVPLAPYYWDHRRAPELRAAVGGSARRVPLFAPDGVAMPLAALGAGDGAPARAERVVLARGTDESWAEAGIVLHDAFANRTYRAHRARDIGAAIDPLRLAAEARCLSEQFGRTSWELPYWHHQSVRIDVVGDTVHATAIRASYPNSIDRLPRLAPAMLRFPIDLELIWHGRLTPADLHPIVRAALFPVAPKPESGPTVQASGPVRVRCRGDWHEVQHRAGWLHLLAHTAAEQQRERALRAFGGVVTGCFAVEQAWTGASGRLPKRLRAERDELWQRILHGGTRAVVDLLDEGLDPDFRDTRGRTLLHLLRAFDHTLVLPRLVARGADVNARDREGNTPLATAVAHGWPLPPVQALVEAGADLNVPSANWPEMTILEGIDYIDDILHSERSAEAQAVIAYLRQV